MCSNRFKTLAEIFAVFAVFFLFGAWQVPDVNEAHYIGKAIHFWNPDWILNDPFLDSKDSHWTFYLVFGWFTFFCSPTAMAWIGRITAWSLLAWSWQRLSFALIPVRWAAFPTALALAYYIESFHMAGEWLIGGIEGKSLAYPFVFFALEAMLRHRWNRVGIFLGVASALHILVGGWATLIIGIIFFTTRSSLFTSEREHQNPLSLTLSQRERGHDWKNFPYIGLLIGGLLALCGLIPALTLDTGTSADILHEAHQIYVFKRLPHHLVPYLIKESFVLRFALLTVIWILLCRQGGTRQRMFNAFVWGTLGIAAVGMIVAYGLPSPPKKWNPSAEILWSAEILRFYWFRLSDIAVPMGVAIGAVRFCLTHPLPKGEGIVKLFPIVLTVSAIIAAIYFMADYLCFGYFKMSPPDQGVPWAITLLICLGLSYFISYKVSNRPPVGCVGASRPGVGNVLRRTSRLLLTLPPSGRQPTTAVCRLPSAVFCLAVAFYAPFTVLPQYADLRTYSGSCRTEAVGPNGKKTGKEWQDMCRWIKENTEPTAKFWIPRNEQTFKWYAQRSDIGTWKNVPQDAESIVQWYRAINELYKYKDAEGKTAEDRLLTTLLNSKTEQEIAALQQKYGFEYILCAQWYEMPKHSTLQMVYENDVYCLYHVLPQ